MEEGDGGGGEVEERTGMEVEDRWRRGKVRWTRFLGNQKVAMQPCSVIVPECISFE